MTPIEAINSATPGAPTADEIMDQVRKELEEHKGQWRRIADASGGEFSHDWVVAIANGSVTSPGIRKIAFDYVVAEPAAAAGALGVVPGDFDWDDVGDFASVARLHSGGRKNDLAILGEDPTVLADKSTGVVVANSKRIVSLVGVRDIVVIDTPDALLVTTTDNAQRVKAVVDALLASGNGHVL